MDVKHRGITLVELMVSLAVGAIFMSLAIPAYFNLVQNNRAAGLANQLTSHLNLARSEAIKRGTNVNVCPANSAYTACVNNGNWANGWIVFVDTNANGLVDNLSNRLKIQEQFPTGVNLTLAGNPISFNSNGFLTGNLATFSLSAAGCTGNYGRQIIISGSGRLSLAQTAC